MKAWIISDLHLEISGNWERTIPEHDIVIVAGDVHPGAFRCADCLAHISSKPIIFVPGNHEFYSTNIDEWDSEWLTALENSAIQNVENLNNRAKIIDGVAFIGATLWTNHQLYSSNPGDVLYFQMVAQRGMNDYFYIKKGDRLLTAYDTSTYYWQSFEYISETIKEMREYDNVRKVVVVTHHLPHINSIAPRFTGSLLNPAFASNTIEHLDVKPDLWIHGHTHTSFDYEVDGVRVLCNPRGYVQGALRENRSFNPDLVIEI